MESYILDKMKHIGKFVIIESNNFLSYFKDLKGNIKLFDSYESAQETAWINELEDVLILEIKGHYKEI